MQKLNQHGLFLVALWLKGAFAIFEAACGVLFFIYTPDSLRSMLGFLLHTELLDDPNDYVAHFVFRILNNVPHGSERFLAIYLLGHGLIKLAIVAGLLSEKLWTFPVGLIAMGLFIIYELDRYAHTHSLVLVGAAALDGLIMMLVWREYRAAKLRTAPSRLV